jgi:hypothetical protein
MMMPDAVAKRTNSNAPTRSASAETTSVMVKPNALINLMKLILNAASRSTSSTTTRNVGANLAQNLPALTETVSP